MADDKQTIVVKRPGKGGGGHHGGAWKIAYADFVTAMMAFFLLMWLLVSATEKEREAIQQYFNRPLIAIFDDPGAASRRTVIEGGGGEVSRRAGQTGEHPPSVPQPPLDARQVEAAYREAELQRLEQLKDKIERAIEASEALRPFRSQLLLDLTSEGLRIQIVDEQNRPMFGVGQTALQPYTKEILHQIGKLLNEVDHKISLAGHTDATPYAQGDRAYSNWELSADRANASRRELLAAGMDEKKVMRVVGLSAAVPLDAKDPYAPPNRRISIVVLNRETEESITRNGGALAPRPAVEPSRLLDTPGVAPGP
jgi:chemotaxis protein MotB